MMKSHLLAVTALLCVIAFAENNIPLKIENGDFETKDKEGKLANWSRTAVQCESNPHSGKLCAEQESNKTTWDVIMHTPFLKVKPNTSYRLTVWNRNTFVDGRAKFGVRCIDAKNSTISVRDKVGYFWRKVISGRNEWTEYSLDFTTPDDIRFINYYFQIAEKDGECCWDDISLVEIQPQATETKGEMP